jgi:ABC-type nitrate/sulfonate/bicarbonate transport system permease component
VSSGSVTRGGSRQFSSRTIPDTLIIQGVSILAFLALWETVSRTGIIFKELVPSLITVAGRVVTLLASGEFWPNLLISLYEIGLGFAVAAVTGVGLGLFLGARIFWGDVFEPVALYLAATPKIIFFPLCVMFFGLDEGSKLAIGALSGFFPILISTITGAREVNPILLRIAKSLRASPLQTYWKVYVPSVLRHIFAGLRLGLGVTIIGTLLGEIKLSRGGLGFMAINFYSQFNLASMYAVIVLIFLLAGSVNWVMGILLARFSRYQSTLKT